MLCAKLADPAPAGAARGRGPTAASATSTSAGHGPFRDARDHDPAIAVGLRWTCGPHSSASGQQQTTCSWKRRSQQPQH